MDKDLNKSRIEVLRDALKDASDTLRAQDRKVSYIIAITLAIFSSYTYIITVIKYPDKSKITFDLVYLSDFFPLIYLIIAILLFFMSYNPVSNPEEVLQEEDRELGRNKFFCFYSKDKEKSAIKLSEEYIQASTSIEALSRIIYIEILKVSKIRERKIGLIKQGNKLLLVGGIFILAQIITLFQLTFFILSTMILFEVCRFFVHIYKTITKKNICEFICY